MEYVVRYGCYRGECDFGLGAVKHQRSGLSIRDTIEEEIAEGGFCDEGEEFQEVGVVNEEKGIGCGSFNCEEGVIVVRDNHPMYERIEKDLTAEGIFSHELLEELSEVSCKG